MSTDRPTYYHCARVVPLAPIPSSAIPLCQGCMREAERWDRYWADEERDRKERAARRRAG